MFVSSMFIQYQTELSRPALKFCNILPAGGVLSLSSLIFLPIPRPWGRARLPRTIYRSPDLAQRKIEKFIKLFHI